MGVSEFGEKLQRVTDVIHSYCRKWRLKAKVSKSTVMTFGNGSLEGSWKWGGTGSAKGIKVYILGD